MGCAKGLIKCVLFLVNAAVWLFGGLILGFSIYLAVDDTIKTQIGFVTQSDGLWNTAVYTMIAVGCLVFLLGFLGCCGAMTENVCALQTYAIILIILLVLELIGVILLLVFQGEIEKAGSDAYLYAVQVEYVDETNPNSVSKVINENHQYFKCCGALSWLDWTNSSFQRAHPLRPVPHTCCVYNDDKAPVSETLCYADAKLPGAENTNYLYKQGCVQGVQSWLKKNGGILIGIAFGVAAVQIIAIIFACCIRNEVKKHDYIA